MKVPLSWLAEYVDLPVSTVELARVLTFAGLEVEAMSFVGKPLPAENEGLEAKVSGFEWDRSHLVVGDVLEVRPHPDADRLVLVDVFDGEEKHQVVTGAPNLFAWKGQGPLAEPLKVAYARTGSQLYDGHKKGWHLTKLKKTKIRGVESSSMVCSEKELGISEEHEGIILFDPDAPVAGTALQDYIGDVVLDIAITPNMSRNASLLGVAREVAALFGETLRLPSQDVAMTGPPIGEKIAVEIREPEINPRFTATLVEGLRVGPSPYWMQHRLRLAGMRPISNIVDVTNYVMLETGQPLHAFDHDILLQRAKASGAEVPTLLTRLAEAGEKLETLDGADRELDDFTILIADAAGVLSLGGIMGGAESEVGDETTNVLLEAASWDLISVRRSVQAQNLQTSEAGYRFSRGVHPAMAARGNRRAAELMRRLGGGEVCRGLFDLYPSPPEPVVVDLPLSEVERYLGAEMPGSEVIAHLEALEFEVEKHGESLRVTVPDHRMDIGTGVVGIADLIEEIARMHGYDNIPETQITDTTPPQHGNAELESEERIRDTLVNLGLQEVITYRLTHPDREARVRVANPDEADSTVQESVQPETTAQGPYVRLANPIAADREVLRRSLLASVIEIVETNARTRESLAFFEIGKVYLPRTGAELPDEPVRLVLVLTGLRQPSSWHGGSPEAMDFFDCKGVVEALMASLHLEEITFEAQAHPSFHPGRSAVVKVGDKVVGALGELHPAVRAAYELPGSNPVLAADFDLAALLSTRVAHYEVREVSRYPAIVEDLALVIDASTPAREVEALILQTGGARLVDLELFDLYHGEQLGVGKKSLAYRLTYQSDEGTLTDKDAARLRNKILKRLERELGAVLRG